MVMPGEMILGLTGTREIECKDCGQPLIVQVLRSNAGYYLGTQCRCGPYSRESGYYPSRELAEKASKDNSFGR